MVKRQVCAQVFDEMCQEEWNLDVPKREVRLLHLHLLAQVPVTFQRLIKQVVVGLSGCAVYRDGVVSNALEEYLLSVRALFHQLV